MEAKMDCIDLAVPGKPLPNDVYYHMACHSTDSAGELRRELATLNILLDNSYPGVSTLVDNLSYYRVSHMILWAQMLYCDCAT